MAEEKRDDKLAVLIDADNISSHYIKAMMQEVARYGTPTIKRIYGDWTRPNLGSWKKVLLDYALTPIQQFGYTTGKNATDSALIIDAMDILYGDQVDAFCLVSSDSDFTRLATRLREAGKLVYGIGEEKTPNAFIAACDKFIYLEILDSEDDEDEHEADERQQPAERSSGQSGRQGRGGEKQNQSADSSQAAKPNRNITTATSAAERQLLSGTAGEERAPVPREQGRRQRRTIHKIDEATRRLVKNCVADLADENGWSYLGDVGTLILKVRPSFDPRNYGYQKLTPMMRAIPGIEIDERSMGQGNARHIFIRNTETEERT